MGGARSQSAPVEDDSQVEDKRHVEVNRRQGRFVLPARSCSSSWTFDLKGLLFNLDFTDWTIFFTSMRIHQESLTRKPLATTASLEESDHTNTGTKGVRFLHSFAFLENEV